MPTEPTTGIDWETFAKQFKTIKGGTTAPSTPSVTGGTYDIPKLQTDIETNRTQLKSAEDALKGYQSKRYDEEYSKYGLGTIKSKVAKIDSDIASAKSMRDVSVSKVRKNPFYSAATITGEADEIARAANAEINNLIDQRNSSAEQYNATLGEVTKKIAMETASKERETEDLRYNLNWMTNQLTTYQTIRSQELSRAKEQEQWEMNFATKLADIEESRKRWETERERLRKETEEAGKRWEAEEERRWYTAKKETGAGTDKALQSIKDDYGNVVGYFNPNTGETHYYTPEEMPTAPATPTAMAFSERDFRNKVADKIKGGESLEAMRDNPGTASVTIKPPSTKTATQIVEEEWAKAHPTSWWGKFKKWLPGGY